MVHDGLYLEDYYHGREVLVTGGLGFLGSTLVRRLVELGATVTVIDACFPDQGANLFNIDDVHDEVNLVVADIGDVDHVSLSLINQEVIFNLAAATSHTGSLKDPLRDLRRNCVSQLRFLDALTALNPGARVIYTGSRSQYGTPVYIPMDEKHPLKPRDVNGVNKTAVEEYHRVFHEQSKLRYTSLRLTNIYGPRHQMRHKGQGFLNWFIRQAILGEDILVYGNGDQERDFVHVDDAVQALLMIAPVPRSEGEVYNLASGVAVTVEEVASMISSLTCARWKKIPYPGDCLHVDPGSVRLDGSRLRDLLGWRPRKDLYEGLMETIDFYRRHGARYFHPQVDRGELSKDHRA